MWFRRLCGLNLTISAVKKPDAMEGIFEKPFGVCVNSKLQILVSDMGNHRLVFATGGFTLSPIFEFDDIIDPC